MSKIQKSDHFLLTVILTIASRDLPEHAVTHCRCWDYTQRLLSGVVLAHPWAQSPRTVQALLLLSEWLPHIQVKSTTSEGNKSLFAEDRTAWSLVGLAVRQGYLLRLDQAAFCEVENDDFKEREEQKRIIWTCECAESPFPFRVGNADSSAPSRLSYGSADFCSLGAGFLVSRPVSLLAIHCIRLSQSQTYPWGDERRPCKRAASYD